MAGRMWLAAGLCAALAWPAPRAMASDVQLELDGWRLQQFGSTVEGTLGKPFKTIDEPPVSRKAYRIGSDAYLVVTARAPLVNNIESLQLTGKSDTATVFSGLHLGDPREKVLAALGAPDEVSRVDSPKVELWKFNDRNYTVEIDEKGRLFSVLIYTDASVADAEPEDIWPSFKAAIASGEFELIEPWLRPDVEIYQDNDTLSVRGRYSAFREAPDAAVVDALIASRNSVRAAIAGHEPEQFARVTENMGVGMAFKFPESSPLEELVFFPYAGRYRLYEVAFREPAAQQPLIHATTVPASARSP